MTLQSSGAISMNDINIELGRASGSSINLNEAAVRALAGKPSGTISLSDFYGKSSFSIGFDNSFNVRDIGSTNRNFAARINIFSNGTVTSEGNSILATATRWGTPTTTGIGSQYEVLVQVNSFFISNPPADNVNFAGVNITSTGNTAWFPISSTRTLTAFASSRSNGGEAAEARGRIFVRQIGNPSTEVNTTFTVFANSDA